MLSFQKHLKGELRRGLAGLPTPKNDFEIVIPDDSDDVGKDDGDMDPNFVEDEADIELERAARLEEESELFGGAVYIYFISGFCPTFL